jgi:uncharacterized repeat protein (TIGR04076 family)
MAKSNYQIEIKEEPMEKEKDEKRKQMLEKRWKKFQEAQGYTDEQMAMYRSNPRYVKAMEHAPKFMTHRIIVEVVESHHCNAGHKVGDKFVLTGNGYLIRDECPEYMCIHALGSFMPYIYAMWERLYEDLDPDMMLFNTVHCPDVGCERGGWGELIMKMYAVKVPKEDRVKLRGATK